MDSKIQFYTVQDIAKMLQVHPESIRRWIREGKLKSIHLGGKYIRISHEDLQAFIINQRRGKD